MQRGPALLVQQILAERAAQRGLLVEVVNGAQAAAQRALHIGQAAQDGVIRTLAPAIQAQSAAETKVVQLEQPCRQARAARIQIKIEQGTAATGAERRSEEHTSK